MSDDCSFPALKLMSLMSKLDNFNKTEPKHGTIMSNHIPVHPHHHRHGLPPPHHCRHHPHHHHHFLEYIKIRICICLVNREVEDFRRTFVEARLWVANSLQLCYQASCATRPKKSCDVQARGSRETTWNCQIKFSLRVLVSWLHAERRLDELSMNCIIWFWFISQRVPEMQLRLSSQAP